MKFIFYHYKDLKLIIYDKLILKLSEKKKREEVKHLNQNKQSLFNEV